MLGLAAGDLVFRLIPGSSINNVRLGHALIAAAPALAGFLADGAAWGVAMGRLALSLFWQVGLAAGFTFLLINLMMESFGWVVGAPGAAERATMITVMAAGNLVAALVGGGLLGLILQQRVPVLDRTIPDRNRANEPAILLDKQ